MSYSEFSTLPAKASASIKPFTVAIPDEELENMVNLLKLTPVADPCYENSPAEGDRRLGLPREWLIQAKKEWETKFDWRKHEKHMNLFPQFTVPVSDTSGDYVVHFAGLFSKKADATPIFLLHGWPGSFLEFLPMLELTRAKYPQAETLPYHLIVPSLPGYAFSSASPINHDIKLDDVARIFDQLAQLLGFGNGYIAQGGDVGSRVARIMSAEHPSCKAAHLNFCYMPEPSSLSEPISESEKLGLQRLNQFVTSGLGYYTEHATRPSTIGLILASNPLAQLAWIGEKFLDWTDEPPSTDTILAFVTLYWVTKCAHTNLYSYRQVFGANAQGHHYPKWHMAKPFGYSRFAKDLAPVPRAWAATTGNLVWYKEHERGGHFAAFEEPAAMLADVEEFHAWLVENKVI